MHFHALHPPEGHNMSQLWNRTEVFLFQPLSTTQHQQAPGCQLDCVAWKCSRWQTSIAFPHRLNSLKSDSKAMLTPLPTLPSSARREMELNSVLQYFYKGASPSVMTTSLFFVARNPFSQSCCKLLCSCNSADSHDIHTTLHSPKRHKSWGNI